MSISRIAGKSQGRCRAVVHNGLVYTVATDTTSSSCISDQTKQTLKAIQKNLEDAGSAKTHILQATVYLQDIAMKAEMDAVWCAWIGDEENWPQRACVGADLAGSDLIEIVVIAALV